MKATHDWKLLLLAMVAGMVGGVIADRMPAIESVWAQQRWPVVNAEEYLLVDKNGKTRGGLGLGADGGVGLILTDREGSKTLYISPDEAQVMRLTDRNGKTLWAMP